MGDTKLYLDSMMSQWQKLLFISIFFNEIMCEGIAVGKTERLNFKVVIMKVLEEEGNRRYDIMCIKVFVVSLKSK